MARFANMPEPEYREDREYVKSAGKSCGVFDASRYEVKPVDTGKFRDCFPGADCPKRPLRLFRPLFPL